MSTSTETLLREIDAFLKKTGMSDNLFSKKVMNDGKFVKRLRSGSSCSLRTADRARQFMKDNARVRFRRPVIKSSRPAA